MCSKPIKNRVQNINFWALITSSCGAFKSRNAEEAWQLIEDLAKCNYKAPSEALGSSNRLKGNGLIRLDRMTAIEAKLDAVMNKLGNNERRMHTVNEVGAVEERIRRSAEELVGEEPNQVEEAKYMNEQTSYHFKPNPNLPTHYTPALRNHENFSYGGGAQQGHRPGQNYRQAYAQLTGRKRGVKTIRLCAQVQASSQVI